MLLSIKEETTYSLRRFESEDHALICSWWRAHHWPEISLTMLPRDGFFVEANGKPTVCGFIYFTGSDISLMEWIVSDPESNPFHRSEALDLLIEELTKFAKAGGARVAITFLTHKRLIEKVKSHDFKVTDTNVTHLLKEL